LGAIGEAPGSEPRPAFAAPMALVDHHDVSEFDCGKPPLSDWLRSNAARNERGGHSRTYVVTPRDSNAVCAYYALAAGGVVIDDVPKRLRRNAPPVIPVTVLGRLAVAKAHQSSGLGRAMLRDAMRRVVRASTEVASAAMMVHAIDDEAAAYYARFGFLRSPEQPRHLFLPLRTILAAL